MPLLDFSNPLVTDASVGMTPEPGSGQPMDPTQATSGLLFPTPAVSGAVTGVVNALGQSVNAFFQNLPFQIGTAVPQPASPLAALGAGGGGLVMLALVGVGAYWLLSKPAPRARRRR
jgi:hypothetical protein